MSSTCTGEHAQDKCCWSPGGVWNVRRVCGSNCERAWRGIHEQPVTENGFLCVHLFCTAGADCIEEFYWIDLISSKLPPVQWHGHQLISAAFLQCSDCPQAPQSWHLLSPWFLREACKFPSRSDFFLQFYCLSNLYSLFELRISQLGQWEPHRSRSCRISQSSAGSLMSNITRTTKLCTSTGIYYLICQGKAQLMILLFWGFFPPSPEILAPQTFSTQRSKFWKLPGRISCCVNIFVGQVILHLIAERSAALQRKGNCLGFGNVCQLPTQGTVWERSGRMYLLNFLKPGLKFMK